MSNNFNGMTNKQLKTVNIKLTAINSILEKTNIEFRGKEGSGYQPFDDTIVFGSEVKNRENELDPADFTVDILNHELQHQAQNSGMDEDESYRTNVINNVLRDNEMASMAERDAMMAQKNPRNSTYYKFLTPKQKKYYDPLIDKAFEEYINGANSQI
jgi:hypothetical protein